MAGAVFIPLDSYRVANYGAMIADRERTAAYAEALQAAITPESVVLDIGAGAGALTLLACQSGARRVIAVEPLDAIDLARDIVTANGYARRVEFVRDVSTNLTLDAPVDVVVSDLRGALPLYRQHIPTLIDARERLLAPQGVLIPREDRLWATLLEVPKQYEHRLDCWRSMPGLDLELARDLVANSPSALAPDHLTARQFLSEPRCWAVLDYLTIRQPNVFARVEWPVVRSGTAHGMGLWFEATLADGITFSAAPGRKSLYSTTLLPFPEAVTLSTDDTVSVGLKASLVEAEYVFSWETVITGPNRQPLEFRQSTLHSVLAGELRRVGANHVPRLAEQGRLDALVLTRMQEELPLGRIADEVAADFASRFHTWEQALGYVAYLSARYSA